jgi:hypothetical protein
VTLGGMRLRSLAALAATLALPGTALAAGVGGPPISKGPVEGFHSPGNHVACVTLLRYNRDGNAVRCGRKGSGRGRLLAWHGPSRKTRWRWPTKRSLHGFYYAAPPGRTLYLTGGTAKLNGNNSMLRCTFTGRDHVRCLNGDGHGIEAGRTYVRAVRINP